MKKIDLILILMEGDTEADVYIPKVLRDDENEPIDTTTEFHVLTTKEGDIVLLPS
jgi:hypothetical protein